MDASAYKALEIFMHAHRGFTTAAMETTGGPILYGIELADLYAQLDGDPKKQERLLPFLDLEYYRGARGLQSGGGSALLADFFESGLARGVPPHPLIEPDYMRFQRPDLFRSGFTAVTFMEALTGNLVDPSPFFSIAHYLKAKAGARDATSAFVEFITDAGDGDASPHPMIDLPYYRDRNPGVPRGALAALLHLIQVGDREGLAPGALFDPAWYSAEYARDPKLAGRPFWHYLRHGQFAGKAPSKLQSTISQSAAGDAASEFRYAPDAETVLANHASVISKVKDIRRKRQASFRTEDIRPVRPDDHGALLAALSFPEVGSPLIDVIIPCHDEFELTVEALAALQASTVSGRMRVILVDDCSADPRYAEFARVPGLVFKRNGENLHFLRSCNRTYAQSTAPFVLLLNNDTQVYPGTLELLLGAAVQDSSVAAAAPMFLYPNGRLQEAGCSLLADGGSVMVGVGDDPRAAAYNRSRDILYGSGACLLLRRSAVGANLFDEAFSPAYCEDADLCIRLRAEGWRIRYVAEARCVHHLSKSTAKSSEDKRLQGIRKNQQRLVEKWSNRLPADLATRVLAFYLPQFHPIPENDLWWGAGFTEWINVAKARPSFAGHYQPHLPADLGFYDLRLAETMAAQMRLARRYGVHGFVMYYYNFSGRRILDRPLRNLLAAPDMDFRFCLCWANENWTKHWDGGSSDEALIVQDYGDETFQSFAEDAIAAARHPGAIKIDEAPLLLVYRPMLIPDVAKRCGELRRRFAEAGFPRLHLACAESMELAAANLSPAELGFDSAVEFPPQGIAKVPRKADPLKQGLLARLFDYEEIVVAACTRPAAGYRRFPGVLPGWDNTPRQPLTHTTLVGATPEKFQAYVELKLDELNGTLTGEERLLFVNAWNEWAEGAHLEPDRAFGHDWLRAISDALAQRQWPAG